MDKNDRIEVNALKLHDLKNEVQLLRRALESGRILFQDIIASLERIENDYLDSLED